MFGIGRRGHHSDRTYTNVTFWVQIDVRQSMLSIGATDGAAPSRGRSPK